MRTSFSRAGLTTLAALGLAIIAGTQAHAQQLSYWNFDSTGATGTMTVTSGINSASAVMTTNFDTGVEPDGTTPNITYAAGVDTTPPPAGTNDYELRLGIGQSNINNGRSLQWTTSTAGFSGIMVSYQNLGSTSGFTTQEFDYSTDGSTFVPFSTYSPNTSTTTLQSFDLSSISALNNDPNAAFRIVFSGSNYAGSKAPNNRIDTVSVTGAPLAAAPEPSGFVAMFVGAGVLGLIAVRRRRVGSVA